MYPHWTPLLTIAVWLSRPCNLQCIFLTCHSKQGEESHELPTRPFALLRMTRCVWANSYIIHYFEAFSSKKQRKSLEKVKIFPIFFADIRKSYTFAALFRTMKAFGRLAQLVQSICLTSRGSAVRIRQRPQQWNEPSSISTEKAAFLRFRAFSSAGSEHLPYKQRVGGSNPSTPTEKSTFR